MNVLTDLTSILPETFPAAGMVCILLLSLFTEKKRVIQSVTLLFLFVPIVLLLQSNAVLRGFFFSGEIHVDSIGNFFRLLVLSGGALTAWIGWDSDELKRISPSGLSLLILGGTLGALFMAIAADLLMIYISVEFVSLLFYLLVLLRDRTPQATEGATKYFIYGAVSSGLMLFAMSHLYGIASSLALTDLSVAFGAGIPEQQPLLYLSFFLFFGGFSYKLAFVPFHFWAPDVYEVSATPVTVFLNVSRIAGFALLVKIFTIVFPESGSVKDLSNVFLVFSIVTMTFGNLAALRQTHVKRLLAYSAIAHAGYVLALFAVWNGSVPAVIAYYMFAYLAMNGGAFLVVQALCKRSEEATLQTMGGLIFRGRLGVLWAVLMALFLFSLIGLPPFVGFFAKYYLLSVLVEEGGYLLAIAVILNTAISIFYYLQIARSMFFNRMEGELEISGSIPLNVAGISIGLLNIIPGIFPAIVSLSSITRW